MQITKCNMCGKEFTVEDRNEGFNKEHKFGYDSNREGDKLELDLCIACTENEAKRYIKKCAINPIRSYA